LSFAARRGGSKFSLSATRSRAPNWSKGTIESGETVEAGAVRELEEKSGVIATAIKVLGTLKMSEPAQEWHFVICQAEALPEAWTHHTIDGGGLDFNFFWHPMSEDPDASWHPVFKRALGFINQHLDSSKLVSDWRLL
jgi:ADP-ribose pyrophosphatase YjhB (NUDIX family)